MDTTGALSTTNESGSAAPQSSRLGNRREALTRRADGTHARWIFFQICVARWAKLTRSDTSTPQLKIGSHPCGAGSSRAVRPRRAKLATTVEAGSTEAQTAHLDERREARPPALRNGHDGGSYPRPWNRVRLCPKAGVWAAAAKRSPAERTAGASDGFSFRSASHCAPSSRAATHQLRK